jgi:hypothetical protein
MSYDSREKKERQKEIKTSRQGYIRCEPRRCPPHPVDKSFITEYEKELRVRYAPDTELESLETR